MVRTSEGHRYMCGTRGLGIVSNAPDVPGMCVVCGIKGLGGLCMCLAQGGVGGEG